MERLYEGPIEPSTGLPAMHPCSDKSADFIKYGLGTIRDLRRAMEDTGFQREMDAKHPGHGFSVIEVMNAHDMIRRWEKNIAERNRERREEGCDEILEL